ncbi:MAG TPA: HEPN domain-containing protein [bacterium (Candidatus Stahlbacteria)]|nr:HEPN domain-containing protein [Candidatus Stahlbacteria bacterium]
MTSAKILFDNDKLEESVAMTYYSMYYSALALFYRVGIRCENHTATLFLLQDVFGVDNAELLAAKSERIDKQYYVDFSISKSEVEKLIKKAEQFNSRLFDFIDRLTEAKITDFLKKFKSAVKRKLPR